MVRRQPCGKLSTTAWWLSSGWIWSLHSPVFNFSLFFFSFFLPQSRFVTFSFLFAKKDKKNQKAKTSMMISPLASKARRDLTERVLGFLRRDANVLLPVDASGRVLERSSFRSTGPHSRAPVVVAGRHTHRWKDGC